MRITNMFLFAMLFGVHLVAAQIGIGTDTPSEKSVLDIRSQVDGSGNFKGLMPPRVPTNIARESIPVQTSDRGMLVYVEETGCLDIYNGNFWEHVNCASSVPPLVPATDVWINEFHYNNIGGDVNEFVEIAGVSGIDLTGYVVVLYNGNNGRVYDTDVLSGTLTDDTGTGFGFTTIVYPTNGIQNGTPDGLALIDPDGIVLEFISYGGTFTAIEGPANGETSADIGITQGNTAADPVGSSLQLMGVGSQSSDFTWTKTTSNTAGNLNTSQTIN